MADAALEEARQKMIARRFGGAAQDSRTGGKGSARRKKKAVHKTAATDDKKIGAALKKLGVSPIADIQEVNMFTKEGEVINFTNPRVQACIAGNTFVVSGPNDTKRIEQLMPGIMSQLGPENAPAIQKLQEMLGAGGPGLAGAMKDANRSALEASDDDSDGEIPDLVEDFEATAKK